VAGNLLRPNGVLTNRIVGEVNGRICVTIGDMVDTGGTIAKTVQQMRVPRDPDKAYLPGMSVAPEPFVRKYAALSAKARRAMPWHDFAYGPGEFERLHFFPADSPGPLLIFVHGGYWQELSETDSSFAALDLVPQGVSFAALGYGLAPRYRLGEIVDMVQRGVHWLFRHAVSLDFDPARVVLAGHSAGAQLAAMCLDSVRAGVLLSGLYELEPLLHTSIGPAIRLSASEVASHSPVRVLRRGMPPLLVVRGADEPVGFTCQQDLFVTAARETGVDVTAKVIAGRHHFDLPLGLGDPADPLGQLVLGLLH
jgi:arylformamidase